jgi:hypothetical protein
MIEMNRTAVGLTRQSIPPAIQLVRLAEWMPGSVAGHDGRVGDSEGWYYTFGATCLYNVNSSITARMQ